jgi:hypothetical protein
VLQRLDGQAAPRAPICVGHRHALAGDPRAYFEKFACTLVSTFIVRVQLGAVPLHAPDQPRKARPGGGVAINATALPAP